jgi:hypothetical protein
MKLSLVVTRDELAALAAELVPARFVFKDERRGAVSFGRALAVELVPATGLRVGGDARVTMAVAGVDVRIVVRAWRLLFCPTIRRDAAGVPSLEFDPVLEQLDVERVPAFLDDRIREGVSEALDAQRRKLAWRFAERLSTTRGMPARMAPSGIFRLSVSAASVVVTREEIRFDVELRPELLLERHERRPAPSPAPPRPGEAEMSASPPGTPSARSARA